MGNVFFWEVRLSVVLGDWIDSERSDGALSDLHLWQRGIRRTHVSHWSHVIEMVRNPKGASFDLSPFVVSVGMIQHSRWCCSLRSTSKPKTATYWRL
jgi:hypothetical protein